MINPINFFLILLFVTNLYTNFLVLNLDNINEKCLLIFSSILQIFAVIAILINYSKSLTIVGKLYCLVLTIGIYIFNNKNIIKMIIILLIITLISRLIFNNCLFYIICEEENINKLSDIGYFILLIIYIIKLYFY